MESAREALRPAQGEQAPQRQKGPLGRSQPLQPITERAPLPRQSAGRILLGAITLVLIIDMLVALYFRSLADRVESGERVSTSIDPANARKTASLMLFVALIAFGVIPAGGIDPIAF
jgi:hypothetical protein